MRRDGRRFTALRTLAGAGACLAATASLRAADADFRYQAGVGIVYSQDVLRTGQDSQDDYLADLPFTASLTVKTPRSDTSFNYVPEYFKYAEFDTLDHLDQRYFGQWHVRPGPRSDFTLRQGYSNTTRRVGFQDLAGAGGSTSEPITGLTRLIAWDVEPRWALGTGPGRSLFVEAIYRGARYGNEDFVDSDQVGIQWGMDGQVGRAQRLGGQVRTDAYRYSKESGPVGPVYDRFVNGQATWSFTEPNRTALTAAAGIYRGSGSDVDPVTGPTADFAATWRWRRSSLLVASGLGYSSGGGLSTTDRIRHVDGNWSATWGRGYQVAVNLGYFRRQTIGGEAGSDEPLYGRAAQLTVTRAWLTGMALHAGISALRQDQLQQTGLSYGEATLGITYTPPSPQTRPVPPAQ